MPLMEKGICQKGYFLLQAVDGVESVTSIRAHMLFHLFLGNGKNTLVRFLYSSKSGLPAYFFSSIGMPETKRVIIHTPSFTAIR
jgi:hypothetical protein